MRPILFHLFESPVPAFGVMVAAALLAGLAWSLAEARREGLDVGLFVDLFSRVAIAGVLGARMLYCAIHREEFADGGVLALFAVWRGGLVLYGGLIAAVLTGILFVRRRRAPVLRCFDIATPGIWLGVAVGRMGCWFVADDYGRPTDGAWGVVFPRVEGSRLDASLFGVPLHPTQLYDSLNAYTAFLVGALVLRRSALPGRAAGVAIALYAAGRFVVEHFRGDDLARGFLGPLSTSQWISLAVLVAGVAMAARFSASARASASGAAG